MHEKDPDEKPYPLLERLLLAVVFGILGFVTGIFLWWAVTMGFAVPLRKFVPVSIALAIFLSVYGFFRIHSAIAMLGVLWKRIGQIANQLFLVGFFRR